MGQQGDAEAARGQNKEPSDSFGDGNRAANAAAIRADRFAEEERG